MSGIYQKQTYTGSISLPTSGTIFLGVDNEGNLFTADSGSNFKYYNSSSASAINTGSFATTGSNNFIGDQIITGSLYNDSGSFRLINGLADFLNVNDIPFVGSYLSSSGIYFHGIATGSNISPSPYVNVMGYNNDISSFYMLGGSDRAVMSYFSFSDNKSNNITITSASITLRTKSNSNSDIHTNFRSADNSMILTVYNGGHVVLPIVSASYNYVDDAAASGAGIPLGGLYHTNGALKIRIV